MATRIKLKRSEIPKSIPTVNDIDVGEVALNTFDQKMYVKDSNGVVVEVANKGANDDEVTTKATIMAIALG